MSPARAPRRAPRPPLALLPLRRERRAPLERRAHVSRRPPRPRAAAISEQYPWLEQNGVLDVLIPKKEPLIVAKWWGALNDYTRGLCRCVSLGMRCRVLRAQMPSCQPMHPRVDGSGARRGGCNEHDCPNRPRAPGHRRSPRARPPTVRPPPIPPCRGAPAPITCRLRSSTTPPCFFRNARAGAQRAAPAPLQLPARLAHSGGTRVQPLAPASAACPAHSPPCCILESLLHFALASYTAFLPRWFPTMRILHQYPDMMPKLRCDQVRVMRRRARTQS